MTTLPIGPLHVALEEPMYFSIQVEGETVTGLEMTAGHVHRGIEYLATKRNLHQNLVLTERVCSLCSNSHPVTYCMALERIAGIEPPPRAQVLRAVADEIKRIASHLFNVAILAHLVGFESLFMHVMQTRELMQDVKETLFGNRMDLGANCIGGVRYDLDAAGLAYLAAQLDKVEADLAEIRRLYAHDRTIAGRTRGVGVLPHGDAVALGVVGPVARASGIAFDLRVKAPYGAYDKLEVPSITRADGDVWSRAMVRLDEVQAAIALLRQCMDLLPAGPRAVTPLPAIPAGEAVARSEAPRGELLYYLRTDGSERPERLHWRVPSYMNWAALAVMMTGAAVADIPLIVNSIDPCISCTER
ncbi:MAG: nickel-dependent hydrogenase large subunit [Magnetospirillum sp.]|nr:nickel-dependent hydrogenase large subunit [Magnetospirillum sp.]